MDKFKGRLFALLALVFLADHLSSHALKVKLQGRDKSIDDHMGFYSDETELEELEEEEGLNESGEKRLLAVIQHLKDIVSKPSSVGVDNVGGEWQAFVEKDEQSKKLLGSAKPPVRTSDSERFFHTARRCQPLSVQERFFTAIDAEFDNLHNFANKPSENFPFQDMSVFSARLMEGKFYNPKLFPKKPKEKPRMDDKLSLSCDVQGHKGLELIHSSGTTALVDATNESSMKFAESLIAAAKFATQYWTDRWQDDGGLDTNVAEQIFREAVLVATGQSPSNSDTDASFMVANFNGKVLNVATKGTETLSVYRRDERSRFGRYPAMMTAETYPEKPWVDGAGNAVKPETYSIPLYEGDLILLMSDGITDNLYAREITELVTRSISPEESVDVVEMEKQILKKEGVLPWKLPHYNSVLLPASSNMLKYTTSLEKLASIIVYSARYHLARQSQAGPYAMKSLLTGDTTGTDFVGRADNMTVVSCWVSSKPNIDMLETLWAENDFVPGAGHQLKDETE